MSKRVNYVEIDLPKCSLTYGVAPCAAILGTTGTKKCFNTRKTCQDIANYTETTETLRLSQATLDLDPDIIAIPNIIGIEYTPSELSLGESIGARAVCTVTCNDHPTPDTGPAGDKYRDSRVKSETENKDLSPGFPRDPELYLNLDENIIDQSGNSNSTSFSGTAAYGLGKIEKALLFSGNNDNLIVDVSEYLFAGPGEEWTLSLWTNIQDGLFFNNGNLIINNDNDGHIIITLRGKENVIDHIIDNIFESIVVTWNGGSANTYIDNIIVVWQTLNELIDTSGNRILDTDGNIIDPNYYYGSV